MDDIYSLLSLNSDLLRGFSLQASRIDNIETERSLKLNIRKLRAIEEKVSERGGVQASKETIEEVLIKVIEVSRSDRRESCEWSFKELRILSYYIVKLQNDENAFQYALYVLNKNWKDIFFNGIVYFTLNSWYYIKPEFRKATCSLIVRKLEKYQGTNKKINSWKNHANYFDEVGQIRMWQLANNKKMDIFDVPSLLGYSSNALSQTYYSDVIIAFANTSDMSLEKLEHIFEIHKLQRTKKLILAQMVEKADKEASEATQTYLCNFINRVLGDVTLAATWAPFPGASWDDAQKLKNAMLLTKKWFARKIIESFFNICVQDRARKVFWLKYIRHISGFRIVGSTLTKNALRSDPTTSELLNSYFIDTNSRTAQTSALILCIKNKVMVEFSDSGALYVYDQDSSMVSFLRKGVKHIASTKDLKDTNIRSLMYQGYWGDWLFNDYGRMAHSGYWADRLSDWMVEKVLNSENRNVSFYESEYETSFNAKPIEIDDSLD